MHCVNKSVIESDKTNGYFAGRPARMYFYDTSQNSS